MTCSEYVSCYILLWALSLETNYKLTDVESKAVDQSKAKQHGAANEVAAGNHILSDLQPVTH